LYHGHICATKPAYRGVQNVTEGDNVAPFKMYPNQKQQKGDHGLGNKGRREYLRAIYERYRKAGRKAKKVILSEFCANTGYHRKYAIRLLNGPRPEKRRTRRERRRSRSATWPAALAWFFATNALARFSSGRPTDFESSRFSQAARNSAPNVGLAARFRRTRRSIEPIEAVGWILYGFLILDECLFWSASLQQHVGNHQAWASSLLPASRKLNQFMKASANL
jgi:hypothetical protein